MDHLNTDRGAAEDRPVSEILAEARALQARHAPRVLDAVASWFRARLAPATGGPSASAARRLVVH